MPYKYVEEGERIKSIRQRLELSQSQFAIRVKANSKGVVSTWEMGKHLPDLQTLSLIAELGRTTVDYIVKGDKSKIREYNIEYPEPKTAAIRQAKEYVQYRIAATVAAGNAEFFDRTSSYEFESLDFDPERYFFVVIDERNGESMFPLLKPGDSVLVDSNPGIRLKDRDIVLAKWDKKAAIKLYGVQGDEVILSSINVSTAPIILNKTKVDCHRVKLIKKK